MWLREQFDVMEIQEQIQDKFPQFQIPCECQVGVKCHVSDRVQMSSISERVAQCNV